MDQQLLLLWLLAEAGQEIEDLERGLREACDSELRLRQRAWNYERLAGHIIAVIEAGQVDWALKLAHQITDGGDPGF